MKQTFIIRKGKPVKIEAPVITIKDTELGGIIKWTDLTKTIGAVK